MFGNPETTTGGMALKFYASVRLDVRRLESIKQGGQTVGSRVRVTVKKNKVAPPFRQAEFDIMYNKGISKSGDLLDLGTSAWTSSRSAARFTASTGTRLGQGRENAKEFLENSPAIAARIEARFGSKRRWRPSRSQWHQRSTKTPIEDRVRSARYSHCAPSEPGHACATGPAVMCVYDRFRDGSAPAGATDHSKLANRYAARWRWHRRLVGVDLNHRSIRLPKGNDSKRQVLYARA